MTHNTKFGIGFRERLEGVGDGCRMHRVFQRAW